MCVGGGSAGRFSLLVPSAEQKEKTGCAPPPLVTPHSNTMPPPSHPDVTDGKAVAVIGSGVTGMATAWLLHRCVFVFFWERVLARGGATGAGVKQRRARPCARMLPRRPGLARQAGA